MPMYKRLNPTEIQATAETLHQRIQERFPDRGLHKVCGEIVETVTRATLVVAKLSNPHWGFRLTLGVVSLVTLVSLGWVLSKVPVRADFGGISDYIQGIQALGQLFVYAGASIYFVVNLETLRKRSQVIKALRTLRSLAHVVDMHQLVKSPETRKSETPSSPKSDLTPFELQRYFSYCSEMLAILGKVAAFYVQDFDDAIAVDAASDIETLTVGLSQKVWQKASLLTDASTS